MSKVKSRRGTPNSLGKAGCTRLWRVTDLNIAKLIRISLVALFVSLIGSTGLTAAPNEYLLVSNQETVLIGSNSGLNGDDVVSAEIPIDFTFSYFGQSVSNVFLSSNGVLQFDQSNTPENSAYENDGLSGFARNYSVYAFWDDLVTNGDNKIRYTTTGIAPNRKFVAQWSNMFFYGSPLQMGTFQVVLYESSNVVQIQYRDIIGGGASQGSSATVGIKGNGSSQVSQFKRNSTEPPTRSGSVITYTPLSPTDSSTYSVSTTQTYESIFLSVPGSPSISQLTSPADDAHNVDLHPVLEWSASTDATSYKLMVARDPSFANMLPGFPKTQDENSFTFLSGLTESTDYYWRVDAINSVATMSSPASRFTTRSTNASPDSISALSGDLRGGSEIAARDLDLKSLTFTISDPDLSQEARYQIQISQSEDFSSQLVDFRSNLARQGVQTFRIGNEGGTYLNGAANTEFPPSDYFIRIRVEDSAGAFSSWITLGSPAFRVPVAPTVSPSPQIQIPTEPTNLLVTVVGDKATLTWKPPSNSSLSGSFRYIATLSSESESLTCETAALTCKILGLRKSTPYEASVIAVNSMGSSRSSNIANVYLPETATATRGTKIPTNFDPTARSLGLSPLQKSVQDQLVQLGIVDAPIDTLTVGLTKDLTANAFSVETLMTENHSIISGTAITMSLTPPLDTPAGTTSYSYLQVPDGSWLLLGSAPAVPGVAVALPAMSFVTPGSYQLVWTLKPPANYQAPNFLLRGISKIAFVTNGQPELGTYTVQLGVDVAKGSAPLPTIGAAAASPTPTPSATEVVTPPVTPAPVTPTDNASGTSDGEVVAFSPMDNPAGVADTAVTALALAAAAGAASRGSNSGKKSGGESNTESECGDQGSVSTIDVNLTGYETGELGKGDSASLWAIPVLTLLDKPSHDASIKTSKFSPLLSKLIMDGAYLRAMVGSTSLLLAISAIFLGLFSAFSLDGEVLPPPVMFLIAIAVIGVFDAFSGFMGMLIFSATVMALANTHAASDIRMLMGVTLLGFGPALLANGSRNFRRDTVRTFDGLWERTIDVAVGSFLAGWSAVAMVGVLPALSGLTLPIAESAKQIGVVVAVATVIRILLEESAARYFPSRLNFIHPTDVPVSPVAQRIIALALRAGVFMFVSAAFIGIEWYLFVGTLLFILPAYLGLIADRFPNNSTLYQIIPAGIPGLIFSLVLGATTVGLVNNLVGDDPLLAKLSFVLVPIPLFALAILGLFGREPHEGDVRWYQRPNFRLMYRVGGVVAFILVLRMTQII